MTKQRISYVPLERMNSAMHEEMERCAREGTPRPESTAVRAHVPNWWNSDARRKNPPRRRRQRCDRGRN